MSIWWPDPDDIQSWLVENGFHSRDWGLLFSAVTRPQATVMGQEMYPGIWLKLAALLDSVQRNRPLLDGNKRLDYLLVALVLRGNDIDQSHVGDDAWYQLIMRVASGHIEIGELAENLERLVNPEN